jgi:hypothetical protein
MTDTMHAIEQCQIEVQRKGDLWRGPEWWFEAIAMGSQGRYVAATSRKVRTKMPGDLTRNTALMAALNDLTAALIADGWQVVPGATRALWLGRIVTPVLQRRAR